MGIKTGSRRMQSKKWIITAISKKTELTVARHFQGLGMQHVVLSVSVISVFDAVAFLSCMHRVSSLVYQD